jgi:hypothetical protein
MYRTTFRFGSKKEVDSCDTRSAGWSCGARTSRQPRGRPKSWGTRVRTKFRSLRGLLSPHLSHKRSSLSRRYQAFGYMDDHHLKFTSNIFGACLNRDHKYYRSVVLLICLYFHNN